MARSDHSTPILLLFSLFLLTKATHNTAPPQHPMPPPPPPPGIKAGYWPSWLNSTFPPTSIKFPYFTHAYYAFVQVDPTSFALNITPFDADLIPDFVAAAHANRPAAVKALLTVGGGGSNRTTFAELASNRSNRLAFITSSVRIARRFGLDGLDLDWEFPGDADQMADLAVLVKEWRAYVDREAAACGRPPLLLSAAVYYAATVPLDGVTRSYPATTMSCNLDWINAMCFDYHGGWDPTATGEHAALYDPTSNVSTSHGIETWLSAGVAPKKVVMGLPLYGRSWKLKNPADNGIGAPAVAIGPGEDGIMLYSAIVEFNLNNSATEVYNGQTVAAYSYAGTSWIGYDDAKSAARKVEFAKGRELGGYFFWALGYDDEDWSISRSAWSAWEK